ncbi:DinB family protein [Enterovibrio calviensis]|uniref:DinB family protein n=1 Tax=Enterovibrio calviensis TaxID=91359 RepID=UPI000487FEC1|nr:DinB family protein [Enterovibrio calviensis]
MELQANLRMMARYNQRINSNLLDICGHLSEDQLNQNTHAFFPSALDHWNHIMFGDLIMLQRLAANNVGGLDDTSLAGFPVSRKVDDTFATTLSGFIPLRHQLDAIICEMVEHLTDEVTSEPFHYTNTEGQRLTKLVGEYCQHLFNHQTHHRGQLTCLLSQFGLDYGCMDLPIVVPEGGAI